MADEDYGALSQRHLTSIKRDMRVSLEDAAVRAMHMPERHPTSGKQILNAPDAEGLYTCQYTGLKVRLDDAIFLGPCTPQVSGTYVCHPSALPEFRKSKRSFDAHEANCNTCQHLERTPHEKRRDGLMLGRCHLQASLKFHPDDYMGMQCYKQRPQKENT